jgi:hypothetical protein
MEEVDTPSLEGLSFDRNGSRWNLAENKQLTRNPVANGTMRVAFATATERT